MDLAFVVYTRNRHLEYRLHFCGSIDGKTTFPWKECGSPAGSNDWSSRDTFPGHHLQGTDLLVKQSAFKFLQILSKDQWRVPCFYDIIQVRNEKARRYLTSMRKKPPIPFGQKFPNADPLSLKLLERLLAFDPKDRPTAEEVLFNF